MRCMILFLSTIFVVEDKSTAHDKVNMVIIHNGIWFIFLSLLAFNFSRTSYDLFYSVFIIL